ncbi:MAG: WD40 repeat domain-containing protein, partial [Anaerolineae bacterium]
QWTTLVITPGAHPLNELAVRLSVPCNDRPAALLRDLETDHRAAALAIRRALADEPGEVKLLLVVDQFEEVLALCRDESERGQFIDALLYTVAAEEGRTVVVPTIRADFYGRCAQYPQLAARVSDGLLVGPMSEEELRAAIERPAAVVGLRLEPGLAEMILDDVAGEPGALPLLSHALLETFERRRGWTLSLAGYAASGGVAGAIAQTADTVFGQFSPQEQAVARNIFLRLTELGEEGAQDTRRRVAPGELVRTAEEAPTVDAVLKTLADARLITTAEDTVEVAHEALIREWPTLRRWLDEDREGLRIHRHLTESAQEWDRLGRDSGELYRGARLAAADEWAEAHPEALNPLEREFLTASRELAERRQREREQRRRRTILALAGGLAIAIVLAIFAFSARATAQREAAVSQSLVLAANAEQAQANGETDLALALALEAVDMDEPPPEAVRTLSALALGPGTRAVWQGHDNVVRDVALSPDGETALSGSCAELRSDGTCGEGELILWDLSIAFNPSSSGPQAVTELRRLEGHTGWVNAVAFSPDGQTALSGSGDAELILWDVETGQIVRRFQGHGSAVNDIALGSDGQTALSGSDDATLILWDVAAGEAVRRFEGHAAGVNSVAFSPDGQTALSGSADRTLILWDVASEEPLRRFEGHVSEVNGAAFVLDARTMLSSGGNTLRLWELETGEQIRKVSFPSVPHLFGVSPDGGTAMFGVESLFLWDIEGWREGQSLSSVAIDVWPESASFSADGHMALSGDSEGTLRLWNLAGQVDFRRFDTDGTPLSAVALSPDGRRLLTGDMTDVVKLWDVESGEVIRRFEGDAVNVSPDSVAFSPDGKYALVGSGDAFGGTETRSLVLWDVQAGEEVRRFEGHRSIIRSVALSPDARLALSGSQGDHGDDLILWDVATGEQIRRFDTEDDTTSIAFSGDGRRALTGSAFFKNVSLWDVATGEEIRRFEHTNMVFDVAFGPGETTALAASADGSLLLWDIETGDVIRRYLGHESPAWDLDVSPDGRYVLSGENYGDIILWDFETGEELRRFTEHAELVTGVTFSPDGERAFSVSLDGALIEWQVADLPLEELIDWAYANRYVRELTCEEREQYRVEPLCSAEVVASEDRSGP